MAIKPERHYDDLYLPRADVHVSVCVVIKSPCEEVVQLSLSFIFDVNQGYLPTRYRWLKNSIDSFTFYLIFH